MLQPVNNVRQAYLNDTPCFGMYCSTPAPRLVEIMGSAGLDFIRIDMEGGAQNIETVQNMIYAAHAVGVTPFVRVTGLHEWEIQAVIKAGALGIILPKVTGPDVVARAVQAVKAPPIGDRRANPLSNTGGYGKVGFAEYTQWANENVILSAQIETKSGVEAISEILSVPGLDMVQSGRGDLSYDYGLQGKADPDEIFQAEKSVICAALAAGKMAAVQYYPLLQDAHVDRVKHYIELGVRCLSVGRDIDFIGPIGRMLAKVRGTL